MPAYGVPRSSNLPSNWAGIDASQTNSKRPTCSQHARRFCASKAKRRPALEVRSIRFGRPPQAKCPRGLNSHIHTVAPRGGLEPPTNRLHLSLRFRKGWTISSSALESDAGRCGNYWLRLLIPSLCTSPATDRLSLGLAQDHHCAVAHTGFPEFTRFSTTRYRAALLDHTSQLACVHYSRSLCRLSYRGIFSCEDIITEMSSSSKSVEQDSPVQ